MRISRVYAVFVVFLLILVLLFQTAPIIAADELYTFMDNLRGKLDAEIDLVNSFISSYNTSDLNSFP